MRFVNRHPFVQLAVLVAAASPVGCNPKLPTGPLSKREKELLEVVLSDSPHKWAWDKKIADDPGYVGNESKARVARVILESHDYGSESVIIHLLYLECPEAQEYLRLMYLRSVGASDPNVRARAVVFLERVSPRDAVAAAVVLLSDESPMVVASAARVIVRNCDSEALWGMLQRLYARTRGKREYYGTWTMLDGNFIEKDYAEARAALRARADTT
jgi:hypothetical protein